MEIFGRLRVTPLFRVGNCKSVELVMGHEDVWGRGSVEVRGGNSTMGSGDRVKANVYDVSMMCWNAVGWSKGDVFRSVKAVDKNDFPAKVIDSYNPDIVWWRFGLGTMRRWNLMGLDGLVGTEFS